MSKLIPGLYEQVLTNRLRDQLEAEAERFATDLRDLRQTDAAARLASHVGNVLRSTLRDLDSEADGLEAQVTVCNRILLLLSSELQRVGLPYLLSERDFVTKELLLGIHPRSAIAAPLPMLRPGIPLPESHLLVNARGETNLGLELRKEILSADRIDLLCSFLLWSGYSKLRGALRTFLGDRVGQMRVITTVYLGATEPRVLDSLVEDGAEVRVNYDTRRTRLHAKAWMFHRASGFPTAYVGSSNLSAAALSDGLEWNVRVGSSDSDVLRKFDATFESYWNDPAFEPYQPARDRSRLLRALRDEERITPASIVSLNVRPYPFQEVILEALQRERAVLGNRRNLVVAATGTGKTVVAALDFQRLREEFRTTNGRWPRLLFVAHRRELLEQARSTFRVILRDPNYGEFLADGERPTEPTAVFATIQSLARMEVTAVPHDQWDVVIIDEFHHAEAASYTRWLEHLTPWTLVGLTATPERADGRDVTRWFAGRIAYELRLWDAIEQGLLSPFQYFALKDSAEVGNCWNRSQRVFDAAALNGLLTGHHARAHQVIQAVEDLVCDPRQMRAIGFCAGRDHARFMAEQFRGAGLKATTVLGDDDDREERISGLRSGEYQALFTVDVLSEGVDIPEMDTALFLRPTESATVFLQQLGRGLRLCAGKRSLTVVDLVSSPDREFRLDRKFLALVGGSRRHLEKQIQDGFPYLPPGCDIQLTNDVRDMVLENLKQALPSTRRRLLEEIRHLGPDVTLETVLGHTGLTVAELYRGRSLTQLRREAGFTVRGDSAIEASASKGLCRLIGFDDSRMLSELLASSDRKDTPDVGGAWRVVLPTLFGEEGFENPEGALRKLWGHPELRAEALQLGRVLLNAGRYTPLPNAQVPLSVHCHYRQEQIVASLTQGIRPKLERIREGVWFIPELHLDVMFVTLSKTAAHFSPSTMYKDFPISPELFHWQTQSTTTAASKKGARNVDHRRLGITPLLFVRDEIRDERNEVNPYLFLGPVSYVRHEGERPMSIVWKLDVPMPAAFFEEHRLAI